MSTRDHKAATRMKLEQAVFQNLTSKCLIKIGACDMETASS